MSADELIDAIQANDIDLVADLLDSRADPNAADQDGYTALVHAVTQRNVDMVIDLLDAGADPNAADYIDGGTALHVAANEGEVRCLRELLQTPDTNLDVQMKDGSTPLYMAISEANVNVINQLLAAKADVNLPGARGMSCLTEAVRMKNLNLVRVLLSNRDIILEDTDDHGMTSLLYAVESGQLRIMDALLHAKASTNVISSDGSSALHLAATQESTACLEMLIDNGCGNVNARDGNGNTAAILAAENEAACNLTMLKELIEEGADIFITNNAGETPGDVLMEVHGVDINSLFDVEDKSLDSYGDEALMLQQSQLLQRAQNIYRKFDTNRNGQIRKMEFAKTLQQMGVRAKLGAKFEQFVEQEFTLIDTNEDGILTFPEFVHSYNRVQKYMTFERKNKAMLQRKKTLAKRKMEISLGDPDEDESVRPATSAGRMSGSSPAFPTLGARPGTAATPSSRGMMSSSAGNAVAEARSIAGTTDRSFIVAMAKQGASGTDPFKQIVDHIIAKIDLAIQSKPAKTTTFEFIKKFFVGKVQKIKSMDKSYEEKARKFFDMADQNKNGALTILEFGKIAAALTKKSVR